jgi:putative hydrolase
MRFTGDFHVHSLYSDGKATLAQNVKAAQARGLETVAMTEHGPRHMVSGMRLKRLPAFLDELDALKQTEDIRVKTGIEANLVGLDGTIDLPKRYADRFEVVGVGFHRSVWGNNAKSNAAFHLARHFGSRKFSKLMSDALIAAMKKNRISFLAHIGQYTGKLDWARIALACALHNVAIEINASGGHLGFSPEEAKTMRDCGAVFVVNSDAHRPERIGDFEAVEPFILAAGLKDMDIVNAQGYTRTRPFGL